MTPRQSFALFCKTGFDVRACAVTPEQIDAAFQAEPSAAREMVAKWGGAIEKRGAAKAKPAVDYAAIYAAANIAGTIAGRASIPQPMTVIGGVPGGPQERWHVADGVCGFAGVVIEDGRSPFAKWLRDNKIGFKNYGRGWYVPVHEYNQSLTRKEAHARAMAEVFRAQGIAARCDSRMD